MHPSPPPEHADTLASAEGAVAARRAQTLVTICQQELERMIVSAELELGARVNEVALATRLGVSRGPVREACRSLVEAGLLESHANRGFFVRHLTHKDVVDLYDVRAGLMRLAGALAASRVTAEQLARMNSMVEAMDAACVADDFARYQALNADFHAVLVTASDNRRLERMYRALAKESRLYRTRGLTTRAALEASNREHRAILAAIASHNADRAAAVMEDHILQGKARFLDAVENELEE